MPTERIYKLQPNRTIHLRGFDRRGAAAALHSATETGFKLSGIFRDLADFAVVVIWDADDFFEHYRIRYLPDFDFSGITLTFDIHTTGTQPIDSPKYNWIDWASLDIIKADGSTAQVRLWDHAMLQSGDFAVASAQFTVQDNGMAYGEQISLWYYNLAFCYTVPKLSAVFYFWWQGDPNYNHYISINGRVYAVLEDGLTAAEIAASLAAQISTNDPQCTASAEGNAVTVTRKGDDGARIDLTASDGNGPDTIWNDGPKTAARKLADAINAQDWSAYVLGLLASRVDNVITLRAARTGTCSVSGSTATYQSGARFTGLAPGDPVRLTDGSNVYWATVLSVSSPTSMTLQDAPPSGTYTYLAPRGGRDGNMITVYAICPDPGLLIGPSSAKFSGGSSDATWRVTLDFSSLNLTQVRQAWLTFAPQQPDSSAYQETEFEVTISNWTVSDPYGRRALKVAAPGSVRVGSRDPGLQYSGQWQTEAGWYYHGFARHTDSQGSSVTIPYTCDRPHDLYIGTSLYTDRGIVQIRVDNDSPTLLDCYLNVEPAIATRRLLRSNLAPGSHIVEITHTGTKNPSSSGYHFYLDFIEAAVPGDVPDPPEISYCAAAATDYDTDHTYKLPPARLLWNLERLGLMGELNHYIGVFWWPQRERVGGVFPEWTVQFGGSWLPGDEAFIEIGGTVLGKTVFLGNTIETIAAHFAYAINQTFVGVWAAAESGTLTVKCTTPVWSFTCSAWKNSQQGTITTSGSLSGGTEGAWMIKPGTSPPLNRAARDWHKDLFGLLASAGREITVAVSMEYVNPPDNPPSAVWAARYLDGIKVETDTGFAGLKSTHCTFSDAVLAHQQATMNYIAQLMGQAGLTPRLQFGEFLWWYFSNYDPNSNPDGGMAYYDDYTKNLARTVLGRDLHSFILPTDDPAVNDYAEANFLRSRIKAHIDAIRSYVLNKYPNSKFEVLWPYDVNYPVPTPSGRGGRLNRYVNLPREYETKAGSGLDRFKSEGLAFGAVERDLNRAKETMIFPFCNGGWPRDSTGYLMPLFNGGCPWENEFRLALGRVPLIVLWAFDHISLYSWPVPLPKNRKRTIVS